MTQRLSRTETYGHRKNKETKQPIKQQKSTNKSTKTNKSVQINKNIKTERSTRTEKQASSATLSRVQRKQQQTKNSPSAKKASQNKIQEAETLPARTDLFPSHRVRLSKWFVNSLIFIFILLTGALVYWGVIGAPPLRTLF
ncbi:hypothetical protein M3231_13755 [Neobacillus mesonae]|nr:hypothetical protein [Neobacillus mesonae]